MVARSLLLAVACLGARVAAEGVVGTAFGFATGTTGGGDAAPAAPSDITELTEWLTDDTPRVILIDKEFDFTGSEGVCTDCACCIPSSNTCGSSGQNAIDSESLDWCGSYPSTTCTYDKAAIEGINVASNKSIVGVGSAGVLKGKGLRLVNGVSNIIIQNIHITELNPSLIWGGDAINLDGTDLIWVDHVKISLIGRQMFVTGYDASNRVTISNSEFDGQTDWSASCDGHHYWTFLGYGNDDKVTFTGNYIHHTSGRSPHLEFNGFYHFFNNYWAENTGHAFDVAEDSNVLAEGNVMESVKTPITTTTVGNIFVANSTTDSSCSSALGRDCIDNLISDSGVFARDDTAVLTNWPSGEEGITVVAASEVKASVVANAGIGKLSSTSSASSAKATSSVATAVQAVSSSAAETTSSSATVAKAVSSSSSSVKSSATSATTLVTKASSSSTTFKVSSTQPASSSAVKSSRISKTHNTRPTTFAAVGNVTTSAVSSTSAVPTATASSTSSSSSSDKITQLIDAIMSLVEEAFGSN